MINNNRQQNGRRRGRGGQRQGGGNQGNGSRIDNRARGNAVQLLEKYKSLASDAQRHGDRVNTEYYLQFADHYFRVVSEQRGRFEEQDRQRQNAQTSFDDDDFDGDDQDNRSDQRDAQPPRDSNRDNGREPRRFDGDRDGNRDAGNREYTRDGGRAAGREQHEPRRDRIEQARNDGPAEGVVATEGDPVDADAQPARPRRPRALRRDDAPTADTLDVAILPPSFAPANDGADPEAEAKPRRRRLRPAAESS